MLCADFRPFGPMVDGHLTRCFVDVIGVPLADWLLLLGFVPVFLAARRQRRRREGIPRVVPRWLAILYAVLIAAAVAMQVLEITRDAISNSGIGLLPFNLAGLLLAFAIIVAGHCRLGGQYLAIAFAPLLILFYAVLIAFSAVRLADDKRAQDMGMPGPSQYLNSDRAIDTGVLIGLYAIGFLVELFTLVRGRKAVARSNEVFVADKY